MTLDTLFEHARRAAGPRAWGAAVELARDGAVQGVSLGDDEVHLRVKARGRALPYEVYLWPDDKDWGCDCELPGGACVHVCAALISLQQGAVHGKALPEPDKTFKVALHYAFTTDDNNNLRLERQIRWPDGRVTPLKRTLADSDVIATRQDTQAEALLAVLPSGSLSGDVLPRLLTFLDGVPHATLDGKPVKLSADPLLFRVRVTDDGEGFKVGLYRPRGVDTWFRGAALIDGVLRPTSYGELTADQRKVLNRGVPFTAEEVSKLVGDMIPRLAERIPVDIETERLPKAEQVVPRVEIVLDESVGGLEVLARLVYGDPPVALIEHGKLKPLGDVVPGRDLAAERAVTREFERTMQIPVGMRRVLPPAQAAEFLAESLPLHDGVVRGAIKPDRFRVVDVPITARVSVAPVDGQRFKLDVLFDSEHGHASPEAVMRAWRTGRSLVPLLEGGYAPLPLDWLEQHGAVLREILEAREGDGTVDRHATAALVELLEEVDAEVPPDLRRLEQFLRGEDVLPHLPITDDFIGELRPYQAAGVEWLGFLRQVGLQGILADDMGLGKTVQALVAMLQTDGPHLVVAPTSVLRNWEREAARFAPRLKVNLYHGPQRVHDPDADVVLTSYALLRMDVEKLRETEWGYAVLDEAQAIKNPRSQTARAAGRIRARHRLAMTGTPVENSLEELWSLFRYLMPGFLGSHEAFRERFVVPIEAGDPKGTEALRSRIRPYVLRRLKRQVATELPPLTDMVIRCEMGDAQRRVYEAVRVAAWKDVQSLLSEGGGRVGTLQILEALLRMRQACCDPALLPGDHSEAGACKLDELEDLLVELVCDDHKALIFSQWTSLLDRVEVRLKKLGIRWVRLDGSTRDRQTVIDAFQSPEGPPVFLLSLKAGGTGLNLTAADYVVHLDPWWNPAVQQQATDRAHRIGQDKPVVSVRLIAEGTLEERILELQDAKRALADAALGTEGGFLRTLSSDELRSLFEAA